METSVSKTAEQQHDAKLPISCRFYRGYTIRNRGYYPPDKCVWWEAVNDETNEADFHAHRLKDVIKMINEALGV
jgi:hypothetical protein